MSDFAIRVPKGRNKWFVNLMNEDTGNGVIMPPSAIQFRVQKTTANGETHSEVLTIQDIANKWEEIKRLHESESQEVNAALDDVNLIEDVFNIADLPPSAIQLGVRHETNEEKDGSEENN